MRVQLIRNPISGSGGMGALVDQLGEELDRRGAYLEIVHTESPADATRLAALTPPDTDAVISAGGDGTLREVVAGLLGKSVPLLVLPSGTENVLARHFGYRRNVAAVIRTLYEGQLAPYDVGVCGAKKFILLVGVGFDADVVHRLHAVREGHISHLTYTFPLLNALRHHGFPEVSVEVDDQHVYSGQAMVWVGVIPRYSLGMRVLHQARTDDGLLDVCILPCRSRSQLVRYGLSLLLRRPVRGSGVQYHQCRTARVTAANGHDVPVQIDGDVGGHLPIACSIIPQGINLLLPQDSPALKRPGTRR